MVVDIIGLDKLFAGLNTAGNGKLSRAELLADVKLDDRPLGPVLQDPDAVDREALGQRLGRVAPIVQSMLGTSDKPARPMLIRPKPSPDTPQ